MAFPTPSKPGGSWPKPSSLPPVDATPVATPVTPTATPVATPVDPLKLMVEKLGELKKAVEDNLAKPVREVQQATRPFGTAFGELKKSLGEQMPGSIQGVGKAFTMLTGTLKSAGVAGMAVAGAFHIVTDIGKQLAQFVALASPADVRLFNQATEDMMAVIGQGLTPMLRLVTSVTRVFADSLGGFSKMFVTIAAGLKPLVSAFGVFAELVGRMGGAFEKIASAYLPMWSALSEAILAVMQAVQPLGDILIDAFAGVTVKAVQGFADIITDLVPYVIAASRAFQDLAKWIAKAVAEVFDMLGMPLPNEGGTKAGSSVGAAVKNTSIGSVEDMYKKAMQSAFSLGSGANPPEARTASAAEAMRAKADEIYKILTEMVNDLRRFGDAVISVAKKPAEILSAPVTAARGVGTAIREKISSTADEVGGSILRTFGLS